MTLREYIDELDRCGQLLRVSCVVSTDLEIAELTDRQSKLDGGGKALLFENTGTEFPVATNIMGSNLRISRALRVDDLSEIERRIDELLGAVMSPKRSFMEKLTMLPRIKEIAGYMPRRKRGSGKCQEVEMEVDMSKLPILKCAPHDAAPFVTLPLVHTVDPDTGSMNVGMYRMQVVDNQTTGMHWHRHKTGESHYLKYKALGQKMPVVVCLGGDPVYTYCATAPLPEGIDEYILAGFIRQKPVRLVKTSVGIEVPDDVDFVIEGYVDTDQEKFYEGPFGDHTGFYSLEDFYPLFHITKITRRSDAILPATLVGIPPMEDFYFALATERIFLKPIQTLIAPEITNLYMPACGVAHNIATVTIRKTYAGQGLKVANALWGAGQMSFNKFCLLFSHTGISFGDPVYNLCKQLQDSLPFFDPMRDVSITKGTLDVLDHAAPATGFGGKAAIDLTIKTVEEGERVENFEPIDVGVGRLLKEYFTAITNNPNDVERLRYTGVKIIILVDKNVPLDTEISVILWLAAANCDPVRDIALSGGCIVVDGRAKVTLLERHPNIVCQSREVISMVDKRWKEYNIGEFIHSPSLKYLSLQFTDSAQIPIQK